MNRLVFTLAVSLVLVSGCNAGKRNVAAVEPQGGVAHQERESQPAAKSATVYTCPMHPEVQSATPGRCPKCGMNLVPRVPEKETH